MNLLKTVKTFTEDLKIGYKLGYYDGKAPRDDRYYGMYNKDETLFIFRAGGRCYTLEPNLFTTLNAIPDFRFLGKGVYTIRKDRVTLPTK